MGSEIKLSVKHLLYTTTGRYVCLDACPGLVANPRPLKPPPLCHRRNQIISSARNRTKHNQRMWSAVSRFRKTDDYGNVNCQFRLVDISTIGRWGAQPSTGPSDLLSAHRSRRRIKRRVGEEEISKGWVYQKWRLLLGTTNNGTIAAYYEPESISPPYHIDDISICQRSFVLRIY